MKLYDVYMNVMEAEVLGVQDGELISEGTVEVHIYKDLDDPEESVLKIIDVEPNSPVFYREFKHD